MSERIRVVQVGLGPIGQSIVDEVARRHTLVGIVDTAPEKVGVEVHGVRVAARVGEALTSAEADVAVVATTSRLVDAEPTITELVDRGLHVVSTCEELIFPWRTQPRLAHALNERAGKMGVAVLGVGVNPGFVMDALPLFATTVCRDVTHVLVERIQDASTRRLPFQHKIGAGLDKDEFARRIADGRLKHVGLIESIDMIVHTLGLDVDAREETIARVTAGTPDDVATGVEQIGRALHGERELVRLVFRATMGEANPRDRVVIEANPRIDLTIAGGVHGDVATVNAVLNGIVAVTHATAGLRTMADTPPLAART